MRLDEFYGDGFVVKNPNYKSKSDLKKGIKPFIKTNDPSADPLGSSDVTYGHMTPSSFSLREITDGDGVAPGFADDAQTVYDQKAYNQRWYEELGNSFFMQGLVGVGLIGAAEGFADLYDVVTGAMWRSMYKDAKDNLDDGSENFSEADDYMYRNALSSWLHDKREDLSKAYPIYVDKERSMLDGGLAHWDWYMQNVPSLFSFLSFAIPSSVATNLLTKSAKLVNIGLKLNKGAKLGEGALNAARAMEVDAASRISSTFRASQAANVVNELDDAGRFIKGVSSSTGETLKLLTNGVLGTHFANNMFAREVAYAKEQELREAFKDEEFFNKVLENNPSLKQFNGDKEQIIKVLSNRAATRDWEFNIITGIPITSQLYAMRGWWKGFANKGGTRAVGAAYRGEVEQFLNAEAKTAAEAFNNSTRGKLTHFFTDRDFGWGSNLRGYWDAAWGNAVNVIAEREADYDLQSNITGKNSSFAERLPGYFSEGRLWDAAFWGFLGGIFSNVVGSAAGSAWTKIKSNSSKFDNIEKTEEEARIDNIKTFAASTRAFQQQVAAILDGNNIYETTEGYVGEAEGYKPQREARSGKYFKRIENETEKEIALERAYRNYVIDMISAAAANGNLSYVKAFFSNEEVIKSMVENKIIDDSEAATFVSKTMNLINEFEDVYNKNLVRLDDLGIDPRISQIITSENVQNHFVIQEIDRTIDRYNKYINDHIETLKQDPAFNETEYREGIANYMLQVYTNELRNRYRKRYNAIKKLKGLAFDVERRELEKVMNIMETQMFNDIHSLGLTLDNNAKAAVQYYARKSISIPLDEHGLPKAGEQAITYDEDAEAFLNDYLDNQGVKNEERDALRKAITSKKLNISDSARSIVTGFNFSEITDKYGEKFAKELSHISANVSYLAKQNIRKWEAQSLINITSDDAISRAKEIFAALDVKAKEQVDKAKKTILDMMDKYDMDEVMDYVNRNTGFVFDILTEDKKALDEAIFLLNLDDKEYSKFILQIQDNYENKRLDAKLIDRAKKAIKDDDIAFDNLATKKYVVKSTDKALNTDADKSAIKSGDKVAFDFTHQYASPYLDTVKNMDDLAEYENKKDGRIEQIKLAGTVISAEHARPKRIARNTKTGDTVEIRYDKDVTSVSLSSLTERERNEVISKLGNEADIEIVDVTETIKKDTLTVNVNDEGIIVYISRDDLTHKITDVKTRKKTEKGTGKGKRKGKGKSKDKPEPRIDITPEEVSETVIDPVIIAARTSNFKKNDEVFATDDFGRIISRGTVSSTRNGLITVDDGKDNKTKYDPNNVFAAKEYIEGKDVYFYEEANESEESLEPETALGALYKEISERFEGRNDITEEEISSIPNPDTDKFSKDSWQSAIGTYLSIMQNYRIANQNTMLNDEFEDDGINYSLLADLSIITKAGLSPEDANNVSVIYSNVANGYVLEYMKKNNIDYSEDNKPIIDALDILKYTYSIRHQINDVYNIMNGLVNYFLYYNGTSDYNYTINLDNIKELSNVELLNNILDTNIEYVESAPIQKFDIASLIDNYKTTYGNNSTFDKILKAIDITKPFRIDIGDNENGGIHFYGGEDGKLYVGSLPKPKFSERENAWIFNNDGWLFTISNSSDRESPFLSLLLDKFRNDDTLRKLLTDYTRADSNTRGMYVDGFKDYLNSHEDLKKYATFDTYLKDEQKQYSKLLEGLKKIFVYANTQSRFSTYKLPAWRDKLVNTARMLSDLINNPTSYEAVVKGVNPGKLYYGDKDDRGYASERLAGYTDNKSAFKMAVCAEDGFLSISGEHFAQPWIGYVQKGNTFCALPYTGAGLRAYAQAYPVNVSVVTNSDRSSHKEAKEIVSAIKEEIINKMAEYATSVNNNDSDIEQKYDDLKNFLLSIFWSQNARRNDNSAYSLFRITREQSDGNNQFTVTADDEKITVGSNGCHITLLKISSSNNGKTFYNSNIFDSTGDTSRLNDIGYFSEDITDIINKLFNNLAFDINFNFIKNDGIRNKKYGSSIVSTDAQGKFIITVGNKSWTYNSYSDFLLSNDLVTFRTKISSTGTNFIQSEVDNGNKSIPQIYAPKIHIELRKKNSPVEESKSLEQSKTISNENAKSDIKNRLLKKEIVSGYDIAKSILGDSDMYNLLTELKLFPDKVVYDLEELVKKLEKKLEKKGKKISPYAATDGQVTYVGEVFMNLFENSDAIALRKLIHEKLHNLLDAEENKGNVEAIREIYNEFKLAINDSKNDSALQAVADKLGVSLSNYKANLNAAVNLSDDDATRLEDFLIETLTNEGVMNALNAIQVSNVGNKKETLWQKILNALMKLLNVNLKNNSLLEKEFNTLTQLETKENNNFADNNNEIDVNSLMFNVDEAMLSTLDDVAIGTADGFISRFNASHREMMREGLDNGIFNIKC